MTALLVSGIVGSTRLSSRGKTVVRAPVISIGFVLGTTLAWADQHSDCSQKVDVDQSIRGCSQIIEKSDREEGGGLGKAYITRGSAYFSKGDYDRAIADFDMAIKLRPKEADAYIKRGFAYDRKDDYNHAIADFGMAITLRPKNASAYTMRADAYEKAGDKDRAIADFRRALEIDPSLQVVKAALQRLGVTP